MAKKQITAASSSTEVRTAYEQIAKAQQEYREALDALKNEQGIPVVPSTGQPLTAQQELNLASGIASKYDYVDVGGNLGSKESGYNVGGDTFYVQGLDNQTKTTLPPESKTTINQDDAFPTSNTNTVVPKINTNPKTNNPSQAKLDQSIVNEAAPSPATQSSQVQPDTSTNTTSAKDSAQAGAALESNSKLQNTQSQNGIVSQNPNELPTTNNLPGRLSDEFLREPAISDSRKKGNIDDAAKNTNPMGTAITGFGNQNSINISPDPGISKPSGTVSIDTTDSVNVPQSAPGTNNKPGVTERPNILHEYANWTYKLAWYMLDNNSYNSIAKTGAVPGNVGRLIAKSGGVGAQQSQEMAGDVYFRNLRITSVIGNRQAAAATNNVELEMTVVEPYGASLIGELAAMALNMTGENSISPAEVAYLIEIDFAGYKDDGSMIPSILKNGKKYIPVKILSIEMALQAAGTVYTISMAPYSFFAMTSRYADMEFGIKLKGKVVSDMLGDGPGGLMSQLNLWEKLKAGESKVASVPDQYAIEIYSFNTKGSRDQSMANSPFAYPQVGGDGTIAKTRDFETNAVGETTYTIPRGSIIKDVIKNIILHSQYFNERVDPKKPYDETKAAELIKIIPVIELLSDYDTARNEFAKKITYKVFNTLNFGEVMAGVGNAPVSDWGYSKIYNWLFTGKNADILDANLVFNMVYFAKMQTNVTEQNTIKLGQTADGLREWADQSYSKKGIATKGGGVSSSGSNVPERYINATVAAEWFDSKLNSSNADNVILDLRIIGDPDWIPQDGSIRGGAIEVGTDLVDRHGSIAVDVAGVYVKLNLRTPRDYDPKTGLMELKADQLTIQGVYQVITAESLFEDGRFTQTLNMVKVPNQEEESAGSRRQTQNNIQGRGGAIPNGTDPALANVSNINASVNTSNNPTTPNAR
jgi:hypothetical protein